MSNVEEKLAKSLTADSTELIAYLPYLLQDLWELGSSPDDIIDLLSKHVRVSAKTRVLDLACGKGAVSVRLAQAFGCRVTGIDILPAFIDHAKAKAREFGVERKCAFMTGDINEAVVTEKAFDIVILGAAGDVLGNVAETLRKLRGTVKTGGYVVIDDAYGTEASDGKYLTREQWHACIRNAGLTLLDERPSTADEIKSTNDEQQSLIVERASELMEKHPDKARLFESYVQSQRAECDELEQEVTGVTMLLRAVAGSA